MGCQIDETETFFGDPDSQIVYVNKVGTFGLDSRVEVIAPHGGSPVSRRLLIRVHQYLAGDGAKGIPSNGAKTRGGYCVEWFGMETDTRPISSGCRRSGRAGWPAVLRRCSRSYRPTRSCSCWIGRGPSSAASTLGPGRRRGRMGCWSSHDATCPDDLQQSRSPRVTGFRPGAAWRAASAELLRRCRGWWLTVDIEGYQPASR